MVVRIHQKTATVLHLQAGVVPTHRHAAAVVGSHNVAYSLVAFLLKSCLQLFNLVRQQCDL